MATKVNYADLPIGNVQGTQVLVDKFQDRQLWQSQKSKKYGVAKIADNHFVSIARVGTLDETQARECLKTGVLPVKPVVVKPAAKK